MGMTKETIREELLRELTEARTMGGDMLPTVWLYGEFLPSLSLKETALYEEAVRALVDEGIIEYTGEECPSYRLTERGMAYIS